MKMKVLLYSVLGLIVLYILFTLGTFMDASQAPKKADIIVSLGGDDGKRIHKAIELYQQGYSESGLFIYTGRVQDRDKKQKKIEIPPLPQSIDKDKLIHIDIRSSRNTMTELLLIRDFMLKNSYKSVLFISTPIHTRRIKVLADHIAKYKENGLSYSLTASYEWKTRSQYLYNEEDRNYVFLEVMKLGYNLIKYNYPFILFTRYHKRMLNGQWAKDVDNIRPLEKSLL